MQAIGFLSRREHSRQELRTKLLDSLRKRAREDAALAAAADEAAEEFARALREQPANGIDDAFAPRAPASAPTLTRDRATGARALAPDRDRTTVPCANAAPAPTLRAALETLTLGNGAALPSRLRASLVATASNGAPTSNLQAAAPTTAVAVASDDVPGDDALERTDPEAAVDRLLDWLVAHQYLSETRFVESRVNARSRKQGALRIKLELSRHGLAMEPEQAAALRETEFARAQALWQRKFGAVATEARERAKQARFLASRGFAAEVVRRILGGRDED